MISPPKEFLTWSAGLYLEKTGINPKINWARDMAAAKKALTWAEEAYDEQGFDALKTAYRNFLNDSFQAQRKYPLLTFLADPHKWAQTMKMEAPEPEKPKTYNMERLTDEEIALRVDKNPVAYIRALRPGTGYLGMAKRLKPDLYARVRAYLLSKHKDLVKNTLQEEIGEILK